MKAGKEYELLVDKLYRELEPNAIVTFDDKIYDPRAQKHRQIDVSIRYKFAGVDHLIIVQAKDHKRKADVAVVDQFQSVIEDTNANKGILISVSGFSKSAINKAKSYGIECLSIHSALNKKWETVLKIPVEKILHDFNLDLSVMLNIAHLAGKKVKLIEETFSYDGINIISSFDLVSDLIFKKFEWDYIKKGKEISIDLANQGLFHSMGNEMLPIHSGILKIKYLKSSKSKFYVDPVNYIYEKNLTNNTKSLHNLTISGEIFESIMKNHHENDPHIEDLPIINAKVFRFNNDYYNMIFNFKTRAFIDGTYLVKGTQLMKNDDRGKAIAELESILKNLKTV